MLTTEQIRAMARKWAVSLIRFHIQGARATMASGGSVTTCARHIAIMRAELTRREA